MIRRKVVILGKDCRAVHIGVGKPALDFLANLAVIKSRSVSRERSPVSGKGSGKGSGKKSGNNKDKANDGVCYQWRTGSCTRENCRFKHAEP